jgi:PAS domain S-box-containing protein
VETVSQTVEGLTAEVARLRAELAGAEAARAADRIELRAAEERARAIIAQSMFSVQILAPDGTTTYVNGAWERLAGATFAQLRAIGYNILADAQLEAKGLMPYIRRGFAGEACEMPAIAYDTAPNGPADRIDHRRYWVQASIYPILDGEGRVREVVLMHQDVTAREEALAEARSAHARLEGEVERRTAALEAANAALREADRYKDEFLSVISHELRTPLNFITGFASILEDEVDGPLNPPQRDAARKILVGAERMSGLVTDLLDFASIQAGMFQLDPAPTPYAEVLEEVVGSLRPLAARKGLAIAVEADVPAPVRLDAARVGQVLTNLLANAVKFTDAGTITIRAARDADGLLTEVADTGCGIAAADLPRLFQRFSQLDMSKTRKAGGTGLGLAISRMLVEAHGGTVGVRSAPGAGSTFWFRLPG